MALLKAVALFLVSALLASAVTLDSDETLQKSCSDGTFKKTAKEYTQPSDSSQLVWTGVFGGPDGFFLEKTVVTISNASTTFPPYTNLVQIVNASVYEPIYESWTSTDFFRIPIPAREGGSVYFTPVLLCFDGILSCGGKDEKGSFCAPFLADGVHSINPGTPGFVSSVGSASATDHAKSTGQRFGPRPNEVSQGELGSGSNGNPKHDNHASYRSPQLPALFLICSIASLLLCI